MSKCGWDFFSKDALPNNHQIITKILQWTKVIYLAQPDWFGSTVPIAFPIYRHTVGRYRVLVNTSTNVLLRGTVDNRRQQSPPCRWLVFSGSVVGPHALGCSQFTINTDNQYCHLVWIRSDMAKYLNINETVIDSFLYEIRFVPRDSSALRSSKCEYRARIGQGEHLPRV